MHERRSIEKDGTVIMELELQDTACGLCQEPLGTCQHSREDRLRYMGLLVLAQPYVDRVVAWWHRWRRHR